MNPLFHFLTSEYFTIYSRFLDQSSLHNHLQPLLFIRFDVYLEYKAVSAPDIRHPQQPMCLPRTVQGDNYRSWEKPKGSWMISLTFDLCLSSPCYCEISNFFSRYIVTVIPSASMATLEYHSNRYRKCKESGIIGSRFKTVESCHCHLFCPPCSPSFFRMSHPPALGFPGLTRSPIRWNRSHWAWWCNVRLFTRQLPIPKSLKVTNIIYQMLIPPYIF